MIYDKITNLPQYAFRNPRLASCVADIMSKLQGEAEDNGDFAKNTISFETVSKAEKRFEAHRKYIDIHIVLEGREYVEVTHADNLTNVTGYDGERDILFGDAAAPATFGGYLQQGYFLVCFPEDAHLVGTHETVVSQVTKIVYKIAI